MDRPCHCANCSCSDLPPVELKLITLNISGPSLVRAADLEKYLIGLDPDVIVLTETRSNPGTHQLIESFRELGFEVVAPMPSSSGERGVAILHRWAAASLPVFPTVTLDHRIVALDVDCPLGLRLLGVYVPSRDASAAKVERKQTFLKQMQALLQDTIATSDILVLGDFNVIGRNHMPRYSNFKAWEYESLDSIAKMGLMDVFAEIHPKVQAHSWIGRMGAGYRYDYAFASESIMNRVIECAYIHEPREAGITDHAGLFMKIAGTTRPSTVFSERPNSTESILV